MPIDLSSYVDQAPDAIVIVDQHGVLEFVNRQAEVLFGYRLDELLGRPVELLLPKDFGIGHVALRERFVADPSLRPMASPASAVRALRADGVEVPVDVALSPVEVDGRMTVMAVIRDVTKRDDAESLLAVLADLRLQVLEGKSRNELLDFVVGSLMSLFGGTFSAALLAGEDSLRMVSYATLEGFVDPPARTIPLNTGLADLFAADEAVVFLGPGPGTPSRVRDWLTGTAEVLVAPVKISDSVDGLLVTGRVDGADPFDETARQAMMTLAHETAISLALRRAERQERRMLVVEDRERIARELHDVVIQRMFAIGMGLQSVLSDPDRLTERAANAVEELDRTVSVIRDSIFDISGVDPFARLGATIEAHAASREVDLEIASSGDLSKLPATLVDAMVAMVDEALTNILQHASASEAEVHFVVGDQAVAVTIQDNGVGLGVASPGGRGLARLREEAGQLGGSLSVGESVLGGVEVRWEVPLGNGD